MFSVIILYFLAGANFVFSGIREGLIKRRLPHYLHVYTGQRAIRAGVVLILFGIMAISCAVALVWAWASGRMTW
jgi:hypothetical protein